MKKPYNPSGDPYTIKNIVSPGNKDLNDHKSYRTNLDDINKPMNESFFTNKDQRPIIDKSYKIKKDTDEKYIIPYQSNISSMRNSFDHIDRHEFKNDDQPYSVL